MKYIIEHMEPGLSDWVELEYKHMAQQVGAENLILSRCSSEIKALQAAGRIAEGVTVAAEEVLSLPGVTKERVVLLDPSASLPLSPEDGERFDYMLFGGILGDHPPRDRTSELRKLGFECRHLLDKQMTTDTAVLVSREVVDGKKRLDELNFVDFPDIKVDKYESVEMPFRYLADEANGQPILPPGFLKYLKEENRSIN